MVGGGYIVLTDYVAWIYLVHGILSLVVDTWLIAIVEVLNTWARQLNAQDCEL